METSDHEGKALCAASTAADISLCVAHGTRVTSSLVAWRGRGREEGRGKMEEGREGGGGEREEREGEGGRGEREEREGEGRGGEREGEGGEERRESRGSVSAPGVPGAVHSQGCARPATQRWRCPRTYRQ